MSPSRKVSPLEATTCALMAHVLAILGQLAIFPVYGLAVTVPQSLSIGVAFTGLLMARGHVLRRLIGQPGAV